MHKNEPDQKSYSISGFGSLVGGQSFGSCQPSAMAQLTSSCTRYIADWGHDGVYSNKFSVAPESVIGLQATHKFTSKLSGTVQLTGRLLEGQKLNVEWAYLTYSLTPNLLVQAGRQRLPLFYHSNAQDIGYSLNTIGLNGMVYGWEVTNYNGANATYRFGVGDWALQAEALAGTENTKNNPYARLFSENKQSVAWKNIMGVNLDFSRDWLSGRLSYNQSQYTQSDEVTGPVLNFDGVLKNKQVFYGAALNADIDHWIFKSELGAVTKPWQRSVFYLVSAAYRIGQFTPTLGYASYFETTPTTDRFWVPRLSVATATVRYDFAKNMDLKIQWNRFVNQFTPPYPPLQGNSNLVNVALDFVF